MEVIAGTPVQITVTFTNEVSTPPALADPTSANLVIQPGYVNAPITIPLSGMVRQSTGVYTYIYQTTGVATKATGPVEHVVQCQGTGTILGTSDPINFAVEPPALGGLT